MELQCKNLKKEYGTTKALKDFSMVFQPGIYGLLGTNGAGKSTLMNLLTDNITRTGGEILLDGTEILTLGKSYRAKIGYMPQQQGFYPYFSPMAFLLYMADLKNLNRKTAKKQSLDLLEKLNLMPVKNKPMGGFSGGMLQRVLLAQALLGNPDILLLDEPTAGLDPKERIRVRNLISNLSKNKIILLATHIVTDIEQIADQVILLKEGELLLSDRPEVLEQTMADKVKIYPEETYCQMETGTFKIGNIFRKEGINYYRLIGDKLPAAGTTPEYITLEDVFLHYLE